MTHEEIRKKLDDVRYYSVTIPLDWREYHAIIEHLLKKNEAFSAIIEHLLQETKTYRAQAGLRAGENHQGEGI
jgi:hypothetical protein